MSEAKTEREELLEKLRDWENPDNYVLDDANWFWCTHERARDAGGVADEAIWLWNEMFPGIVEIEHGSPIADFLTALAYASQKFALEAVGNALGLTEREVGSAVALHLEDKRSEPTRAPIGWDGVQAEVLEYRAWKP